MLRRLRSSFAAKLLAGGLGLSLGLIGAVSTYLLISRDRQTTGAAESNADNRAAVLAQILVRFTGGQSLSAAQGLAAQPLLVAALNDPIDPGAAVRRLFSASAPADLGGEALIVLDASGRLAYASSGTSRVVGNIAPPISIAQALAGSGHCSPELEAGQGTACGIELVAGAPAYDVAVPVAAGGRIIGVVAYLAPLREQLGRYQALLQYPVAFIDATHPDTLLRLSSKGISRGATPADIAAGVRGGTQRTAHQVYDSPGGVQVVGSYVSILGPDNAVAGWVGVEAPLSDFVGDTRTDELTVLLIAVLAMIVIALAVIVFVARVVRRPVARLERGVARIAGGDYTSKIPVTSGDELGRLARSVNRMRDSINDYVSEIERGKARLDSAVNRISDVSRAMTGTALGVSALEHEVVAAAAALGGAHASAWLAIRDGSLLVVRAEHHDPPTPPRLSLENDVAQRLLAGKIVTQIDKLGDEPGLLAVPMFYQGEVIGALAILAPSGPRLEAERDVLVVLANNAAIARENARLFEQERATVQRLRELDAMKNDFLGTVQHELRTPLTAILGMADLIELCWEMWEDPAKLEAVGDIQLAARNLYDIVETIIDFSVLDGENLGLHPQPVDLRASVEKALATVAERYKGGIDIPVEIDVEPGVVVYADAERLDQILRALLDNAVKFSDGQGMVRVSASAHDPDRVRIEISDRGVGIPEPDLPRVFDRFFQVDNTATRRYGGTGMGLALVRRLVDAHGAAIRIESTAGKGTRVILDWPAAAEHAGGEARRAAEEGGEIAVSAETAGAATEPVQ